MNTFNVPVICRDGITRVYKVRAATAFGACEYAKHEAYLDGHDGATAMTAFLEVKS